MKFGNLRGVVDSVNEACACGGGGPADCCPACEVYHAIKDMDARDPDDAERLRAIEKEVSRWAKEGGPNAALEAIKKILGVEP